MSLYFAYTPNIKTRKVELATQISKDNPTVGYDFFRNYFLSPMTYRVRARVVG